VEEVVLPGFGPSGLATRLYAPSNDRLPVLLYFHGGGFVVGNLETHDALCRQLAIRSGGAVLAVDYRLAPEHRFPAAVDDAWAALVWLARNGESLGLNASCIAVGGDSAGGTLAAVSALHARNIGLPIVLQLLITPGTAAHGDTASRHLFGDGFLLDSVTIEWFYDLVIDRDQRRDWRFAPLEARDVVGVAPACMVLAQCDPLVDEGIAYADRLTRSGVPVQLEVVAGVTHNFIKMGRVVREANAALQLAAKALAAAWRTAP
jgi:acetyl esterase